MPENLPFNSCDKLLQPYLHTPSVPTLWYADENVTLTVPPHPLLTLVSNRYDVVEQAKRRNFHAIFSDFDPLTYPAQTEFSRIVYRVSKEKALVHYLLNQASDRLKGRGELIICGQKNDGIKNYANKLSKQKQAVGTLKKQGNDYLGCFTQLSVDNHFDDQNYAALQQVAIKNHRHPNTLSHFYSKPGVFGWNKIDHGTQLLLAETAKILQQSTHSFQTVLDLGCGYGWIFLNLDTYGFKHIIATDNNAAALLAAEKNAELMTTPCTILAGDSGSTVKSHCDLVLCNPPFHQGFQHQQSLTEKFVRACANHLKPSGTAIMVTNEFIGCESIAKHYFRRQRLLIKQDGFKVLCFEK